MLYSAGGIEAARGGAVNCRRGRSSRERCCKLLEGKEQHREVL